MAQIADSFTIRVQFRWWVWPFVTAATFAALPFTLTMGDDQIDGYCERIAKMVVARGIKMVVI